MTRAVVVCSDAGCPRAFGVDPARMFSTRLWRAPIILLLLLAVAACGGEESLAPGSPFGVVVIAFEPGAQAGFGQDRMPDVVLGPPRGGGDATQSTDVVSLGVGGTITLELGLAAVDGPGADLIVFENVFRAGGSGPLFREPGHVSLSEDGADFVDIPCDPEGEGFPGCAGVSPVYANADANDIDPTDEETAGGDPIDLAGTGLSRARFVRITDSGIDRGFGAPSGGFDLDAVAVVHTDR